MLPLCLKNAEFPLGLRVNVEVPIILPFITLLFFELSEGDAPRASEKGLCTLLTILRSSLAV